MRLGTRKISKYLGRIYNGWVVSGQVRYENGTHSRYNYYLSKYDPRFKEMITIYVSADSIRKLDRGEITMRSLIAGKAACCRNSVLPESNRVYITELN